MAIKISQLDAQADPVGEAVLPIVQGGTTFKTTIAAVVGVFLPTTLIGADTGKMAYADGAAGEYVLTAAPTAAGQTMVWNGTSWGPGALNLSDGDAVSTTIPTPVAGDVNKMLYVSGAGALVLTSTVKSDGTSLFLGSGTTATGALINTIRTDAIIRSRNEGNTDDIDILGVNNVNRLIVGGLTKPPAQVVIGALNTGSVRLFFSNVERFNFTDAAFSLPLGGTAATSGSVRFANNANQVWRNAANDGNVGGVQVESNNRLILGDSAGATRIQYRVAAASIHEFFVSSTPEYSLSSTHADFTDNELRFGTNPATGARINVANNVTVISARNAANDANLALLAVTNSNGLILGMTSGAGLMVASMVSNVATGGSFDWRVNNTTVANLNATRLNLASGVVLQFAVSTTAGLINTAHNVNLWSSVTSGAAAVTLATWGVGLSDQLQIGATTGVANTVLDAATQVIIRQAGGNKVVVTANDVQINTEIKWGGSSATAAAGSGHNRTRHGIVFWAGRDQADSNNVSLARWGSESNNVLEFGQDTVVLGINERVAAGGTWAVKANGANVLTVDTAKLFIADTTAAPGSNPTGGGYLYSEGGAGKWRGSSGTVTTFGPAEPHCPRCGSDFVHEWHNDRFGGRHAVCIKCLVGALERHGVSPDEWVIERAAA